MSGAVPIQVPTDQPGFHVLLPAPPQQGAPQAMWEAWIAMARAWAEKCHITLPQVETLARQLEQHAGRSA